uniref:Uncharacterized protein n=1 Tax=Avena sativa TaxID=4498 RepID=A0ACD5TBP4_AVESA
MTARFRRRRRGYPHSPAAAPLDVDDLLIEILLRLPPQPSSLPRASLVCRRWRQLVSDPRFVRRFRLHHRSNPTLLGYFEGYHGEAFVPTLDAPNRVAPGRFSFQLDDGGCFVPLGCRHARPRTNAGHEAETGPGVGPCHLRPAPSRPSSVSQFVAKDSLTNGAVLRPAGDDHFHVVLVVEGYDEELRTGVLACIYSSETGVWGNLMSTPLPSTSCLSCMPAVLVGDSLYWTLIGKFAGILEFDLERQSLAVIQVPVDMPEHASEFTVMRAEGGGLGFLFVSGGDLSAQLWKWKKDCDGVASWELARTVELDKLLSLNSEVVRDCMIIVGFAECNNVVFLWTLLLGVFMVEIESLRFKKLPQAHNMCCKPFESVYAAETCIGGGRRGGAGVMHNT